MSTHVVLRVSGVKRALADLTGYIERPKDYRPAWPAVVRTFQAIERAAFESEGRSSGGAWPALAPRTVADRIRFGFPGAHPILQRTHALQQALTVGVGAYVQMTPTVLTYALAPELGYFKFHQSKAPRRLLPRRPPVRFTPDDRVRLMSPIRLYLRKGPQGGPS